ncbi:MAG: hypothetical protein ACREQQ_02445 [Candidatus Binatia bacterium]
MGGDRLQDQTDAVHTVVPGQSYQREWHHRGGDFKGNEGSWTLVPAAGGTATLATYTALAEPNDPDLDPPLRSAGDAAEHDGGATETAHQTVSPFRVVS